METMKNLPISGRAIGHSEDVHICMHKALQQRWRVNCTGNQLIVGLIAMAAALPATTTAGMLQAEFDSCTNACKLAFHLGMIAQASRGDSTRRLRGSLMLC